MDVRNEKRIQLTIDIDEGFRHKIKVLSVLRNVTVKTWVLHALQKEYNLQAGNPLKKCECYKE